MTPFTVVRLMRRMKDGSHRLEHVVYDDAASSPKQQMAYAVAACRKSFARWQTHILWAEVYSFQDPTLSLRVDDPLTGQRPLVTPRNKRQAAPEGAES